jgi:TonB-linked SusC/RagA family outer membrane protein
LVGGINPIADMDQDISGYKKFGNKFLKSSASLTYEIPGVKGLELKGMFSYDYTIADNKFSRKQYSTWRYDKASDVYTGYQANGPNRIERESFGRAQTLGQLSLGYTNTFGVHKVAGLLALETQKRDGDNFYARREMALPLDYIMGGRTTNQEGYMYYGAGDLYINSNNAFIGKFNYSFSDKYLAEFLFRYDGSSKFAPGSTQWGFFPAASVGWRISEENFFKNSPLSFINQFKLRASYGETGDDGASSYQFISGYNYPTSGSSQREFSAGYVFNGAYTASADNKGIPNTLITWYTAKTTNIGIDWDAWHGLFGGTFEYFSRKRDGLLASRIGGIPTVVGAALPQENLNSDRTFGLELELTHRNRINDLLYGIKAIGSVTRVKRLFLERAESNSSWSNWRNNDNNRMQGREGGLGAAGRFESWDDIWNSSIRIGRGTLPGAYIYEDWNGDGMIDGNDFHSIRFNQYPWVNFSMIFDAAWKGFDLNLLLQGSALSSYKYREQLREPMWAHDEASTMTQFMDRWHPADIKADPWNPATQWIPGYYAYTGTFADENSAFNTVNGAYLRLKSVELGYTLPKIQGIESLRVFANAYNIFTVTKVKWIDPEHADNDMGYWYPLNKTVSLGVNITF